MFWVLPHPSEKSPLSVISNFVWEPEPITIKMQSLDLRSGSKKLLPASRQFCPHFLINKQGRGFFFYHDWFCTVGVQDLHWCPRPPVVVKKHGLAWMWQKEDFVQSFSSPLWLHVFFVLPFPIETSQINLWIQTKSWVTGHFPTSLQSVRVFLFRSYSLRWKRQCCVFTFVNV